ncbi:hypothetical protein OCH7691_01746 [Oceanibacterium hippocampi]|uniref:DUF374 domain-containing protein n=2 Tax=Oceanibacterium hippocampi TaxID=745714 RepID=A0A1Y5SI13_9PROT|nr:hypothetical protein OCH7691_01746 [Oceanibacterium hippocampi]
MVRHLTCLVIAGYIWLVFRSGRWREQGGEVPRGFWDAGRPFIIAFWHGRLLMVPVFWRRGRRLRVLISQHRDGALIADSVAHFGLENIRGSSSRGATSALRAMLRTLQEGDCVGITPDGPRGPRMRASDGVVKLASRAGVPIVPAAFSARRRRLMPSWDRFVLPAPFSSGLFLWGEPIEVPARADAAALEVARADVERRLTALADEADRLCGQPPVPPATAGDAPRGAVGEARTG